MTKDIRSDNLELSIRETDHSGYEDSYNPDTTLRAEYNFTEHIFLINKANQIKATYSWIKGHQEDYTEL